MDLHSNLAGMCTSIRKWVRDQRFASTLPRYHGAVVGEDSENKPTAQNHVDSDKTVLVVDDEPSVRMLVVDILKDLEYSALEAGNSVAGLKILQSDPRIDFLITDVGLPGGMNGRQIADAGRVIWPELKILFITGYAENAILGNEMLQSGMALMIKPFSLEEMAARIRLMMNENVGN